MVASSDRHHNPRSDRRLACPPEQSSAPPPAAKRRTRMQPTASAVGTDAPPDTPKGRQRLAQKQTNSARGTSYRQNEDFENAEEPGEEEEEEAKNGHLEIQAMADPSPRSDRRLACPARQRRGRGRPRLQSCLEFESPLKGHNFIGSASEGQDFIGSALKGRDFQSCRTSAKSSALAAAGSQLGKGTTFSRAAQGWRGPASAAGGLLCRIRDAGHHLDN